MSDQAKEAVMEVRGVLLPLQAGQLLLPNTSISEVVGYRQPDSHPQNAPEWLLGNMSWRQFQVPLINFDLLLDKRQREIGQRARIAICNSISGLVQRPYIAILLRTIPRLAKVTEATIAPVDETGEPLPMIARHVSINGQEAWIPDLDALETELSRILD